MTAAPKTLGDLASYVRSKNAGPYWLTIDVFCAQATDYERVVRSPLTDPRAVAASSSADPKSVHIFTLPELRAVKVSLPRPSVQGSLRDRDAHAGQQYVPLLDMVID